MLGVVELCVTYWGSVCHTVTCSSGQGGAGENRPYGGERGNGAHAGNMAPPFHARDKKAHAGGRSEFLNSISIT
eukprot:1185075-Prorocentrum_minimum.AAC.2